MRYVEPKKFGTLKNTVWIKSNEFYYHFLQ